MAGDLLGRSGAIQAALNLELGTETISRFDLRIEGLNGQLPNLDFVNTAVRLCKREGITPTLQKRVSSQRCAIKSCGFLHNSLVTLILMFIIFFQLSPFPSNILTFGAT
jgi:Gaa1-like, GPI transamidase component